MLARPAAEIAPPVGEEDHGALVAPFRARPEHDLLLQPIGPSLDRLGRIGLPAEDDGDQREEPDDEPADRAGENGELHGPSPAGAMPATAPSPWARA